MVDAGRPVKISGRAGGKLGSIGVTLALLEVLDWFRGLY
jgi:hypothetical protein